MSVRALDLARLAADERTPIHEHEAAALALAKIIARDGLPRAEERQRTIFERVWDEDRRLQALQRERDALAEIVRQNASEIEMLRADKRELEERLSEASRVRFMTSMRGPW
jgi:predicted RNase H-like nuclease (RuvC/YqgF family)